MFSGEAVSGPPWGILGAPGTLLRRHGPDKATPPGYVGGLLGGNPGAIWGYHGAVYTRLGNVVKLSNSVLRRLEALSGSYRLGSVCVVARARRDYA